MNLTEHLITCLGEEGAEITQICSKINRFGVGDRNVLDPSGPTNVERLIAELNDLMAVVHLMERAGLIPYDWDDPHAQLKKEQKVSKFMDYARKKGTLQ